LTPEQKARQMMAEARAAQRGGDNLKALSLANQVEMMKVVLDRPGEDTPAAIRRDLDLAKASLPKVPPPGGVAPLPTPPPAAAVADMNKKRAQALLAEARQLQKDAKLLEARRKALE